MPAPHCSGSSRSAMTPVYAPAGPRVELTALAGGEPSQIGTAATEERLRCVEALVLGYDVEQGPARRCLDRALHETTQAVTSCRGGGPRRLRPSVAVAPERRGARKPTARRAGPRELFNTYVRSLDLEREGRPIWFSRAAARPLAHYGITTRAAGPSWRRPCRASSSPTNAAPISCRSSRSSTTWRRAPSPRTTRPCARRSTG